MKNIINTNKRSLKKYTIDDVRNDFNKIGLELITNRYDGVIGKYKYICRRHREYGIKEITYRTVLRNIKENKITCPECRKEINSKKIYSGIYCITNKIDNKKYVGQSVDIKRRWHQHKIELNNNTHCNTHLQNAWNKYGENNFKFDILFKSNDIEEINKMERYYIRLYNSIDQKYGYNIEFGGNGVGTKSEEQKKLISINKRGQKSNLNFDQVLKIKMALYCGIDRKELYNKFNTNKAVITAICMGTNFSYVASELNEYIHDIRKSYCDERNKEILKLYDEGYTIKEISTLKQLTTSIVEKVVYTHRNINSDKNVKNKKVTEQISLEIYKLYINGVKTKDIAEKYNITYTTVKYEINKYKNIENYNNINDMDLEEIVI